MPQKEPIVTRSLPTNDDLAPAPLDPTWIVDGDPHPRSRPLALDRDRTISATLWDCTTGRFDWHYGPDEIVEILAGEAELTFPSGVITPIRAGDMIYFPGAQVVQWYVPTYVRKVTHYSSHIPAWRRFAQRIPFARRIVQVVRARTLMA